MAEKSEIRNSKSEIGESEISIETLLVETGALLHGHFRLSSGLHSPNYVQCAKLLELPSVADRIGAALAGKVREFAPQRIVAPALGGVIIGYTTAAALNVPSIFTERKEGMMTLRRGFSISPGERIVIVEDVVTTGKSTRETAAVVEQHGGIVAGFASILNRSGIENPFASPYANLLAMSLETFEESQCRLCREGQPIDSPGSRYSK
jgi:orotate phosphoribosyltransferase